MNEQQVLMGDGGRIVIPALFRKAIGVSKGDELLIRLHDGEIRIFTQQEALARIRKAAQKIKKKGMSITDDFIANRRKEWAE